MVENIRNYFDVLCRFEPNYTPASLGAPQTRQTNKTKRKPSRR
jgi:hypothetical protein